MRGTIRGGKDPPRGPAQLEHKVGGYRILTHRTADTIGAEKLFAHAV